MTIQELDKLALKHYEQGGDGIIECWDTAEKQAFLDEHGDKAEQEALQMFGIWHERAEGIRNTAF